MRLGWVTPEQVMAVLYGVGCFTLGVSFAAYRAVGWVERMRRWARDSEVPS